MPTPFKRFQILSACVLAACLGFFTSMSAFGETKLLIHQGIQTQNLDTAYLNQIFAMQVRKWPNGTPIHVFVFPSSSKLHRDFVVSHLNTQAHQLDRIWNRMLFTGTGKPPTVVNSENDMYLRILNTPGAIGYVSAAYPVKDVRVLGEKQK
ncbi:substrate-binding domain-containing protein [Marinobacter sp.]|uniref:substrate-binding domain-containing protein n=1 Tax=Marinobacter sp. TaxID=50741 RepID=UPI002B27A1B3|nr:substrate-binding domain-containing protein [Marinobacter sp.]